MSPRLVGVGLVVIMALFLFLPFGSAVVKSFLAYDAARPERTGEFVGAENYSSLFLREPEFFSSLRATGVTLAAGLAQCLIAFALALWLDRLWPFRLPSFLSLSLVFPLLLSPTLVALMGRLYLHDQVGPVARLLVASGLSASTRAPLTTTGNAFFWLCMLDAWQWIPFCALLFWLCFRVVPQRMLEAAAIDGLSRGAMLRWVILPRITPFLVSVVLIRVLEVVRLFDLPNVLTGGGPGTATLTVSIYATRVTFAHQRFGVASAHMLVIYTLVSLAIVPLLRRAKKLRALIKGQAQ